MKEQLDHRDIDAFGRNIGKVWELNKTLDSDGLEMSVL